jgi:hypothetical protein
MNMLGRATTWRRYTIGYPDSTIFYPHGLGRLIWVVLGSVQEVIGATRKTDAVGSTPDPTTKNG